MKVLETNPDGTQSSEALHSTAYSPDDHSSTKHDASTTLISLSTQNRDFVINQGGTIEKQGLVVVTKETATLVDENVFVNLTHVIIEEIFPALEATGFFQSLCDSRVLPDG